MWVKTEVAKARSMAPSATGNTVSASGDLAGLVVLAVPDVQMLEAHMRPALEPAAAGLDARLRDVEPHVGSVAFEECRELFGDPAVAAADVEHAVGRGQARVILEVAEQLRADRREVTVADIVDECPGFGPPRGIG